MIDICGFGYGRLRLHTFLFGYKLFFFRHFAVGVFFSFILQCPLFL